MPTSPSTQLNIPIAGLKDGIVILRDGSYRIILEVTAINFDLKSEQEQNSIVFKYQSFLNSLHFPVQIVIQSKKLDLTPYLKKIKSLSDKQTNELLKIQTRDYAEFVEQLINVANIMKKSFYVSVGFTPINMKQGFLDKLIKRSDMGNKIKISEVDFDSHSKELRQRAQSVAQGLGGIGLRCKQLSTKEIIELFYEIYNPEIAGKERLTDPDMVSGNYVTQLKKSSDDQNKPDVPNQNQSAAPNAEQVIDNTAMVAAVQQEHNREIARENAKAETGAKEQPDVDAEPLPGEQAGGAAAAQPNTAAQNNDQRYGK